MRSCVRSRPPGCCWETMAGKGTEIGGRFEELRAILDRVELVEPYGGYAWIPAMSMTEAMTSVRRIWMEFWKSSTRSSVWTGLKAIHMNDSKNSPGKP